MASTNRIDLTTGSPIKQILRFSLPLVMGSFFQQMYSFVDTIMVGRLIGNDALAAVGSVSALNLVVLGFTNGTCAGFGIPLAKAIGAKDAPEFKRYLWNGIWISLLLSVIMAVLTSCFVEPMLRLIMIPADIYDRSLTYIRIIFWFIPTTVLYNFSSAVLRATGDSRRPTNHLLFSSCLNIVLDYIFIVPLSMDVAGAALATVLSQLLSGLLNLRWILFKTDLLHHSRGLRKLSLAHSQELCRVGFPMGFDHAFVMLGSVVMQGAINTLGTTAVTGQTAGEKVRQLFTIPMSSVGTGMATYVGQNDGAKKYDRLQSGIRSALTLQFCYSILACLVMNLGKGAFVSLILGRDSGQAGIYAQQYLTVMSLLLFVQGFMMVLRNTLQGMGYSGQAVLNGMFEMVGKIIGSFLAVKWFGFMGICIATPLAWLLGMIYCAILVNHYVKQRLKLQ